MYTSISLSHLLVVAVCCTNMLKLAVFETLTNTETFLPLFRNLLTPTPSGSQTETVTLQLAGYHANNGNKVPSTMGGYCRSRLQLIRLRLRQTESGKGREHCGESEPTDFKQMSVLGNSPLMHKRGRRAFRFLKS